MAAPERAKLPDGDDIALAPLAEEICRRYRAEYPDEERRYGDAGIAWCIHDNQHILNWAALELAGLEDLGEQVAWLAGVLEARDFPLERLARDLEIAADVVEATLADPDGLSQRLRAGASLVRGRPSFLAD